MAEPGMMEQISEVERELAIRKNVYPKWIKSGRLASKTAERAVARLTAALASLRTLGQFGKVVQAEYDGSGPAVKIQVSQNDVATWYAKMDETDDA